MDCELCGKSNIIGYANVEGVRFSVCQACSRHGKLILPPSVKPGKQRQEHPEEQIITDYAASILHARQKIGLAQEALAQQLQEKISLLQRIEAGQARPSIALAKKIERALKITLISTEEYLEQQPASAKKTSGLTIGDLIKRQG